MKTSQNILTSQKCPYFPDKMLVLSMLHVQWGRWTPLEFPGEPPSIITLASPALLSSHAHCVSEHDLHHRGWTCPFETSTMNSNFIIWIGEGIIQIQIELSDVNRWEQLHHVGCRKGTASDQKTPQQIVRTAEKISLPSLYYGQWHMFHLKEDRVVNDPTCSSHTPFTVQFQIPMHLGSYLIHLRYKISFIITRYVQKMCFFHVLLYRTLPLLKYIFYPLIFWQTEERGCSEVACSWGANRARKPVVPANRSALVISIHTTHDPCLKHLRWLLVHSYTDLKILLLTFKAAPSNCTELLETYTPSASPLLPSFPPTCPSAHLPMELKYFTCSSPKFGIYSHGLWHLCPPSHPTCSSGLSTHTLTFQLYCV